MAQAAESERMRLAWIALATGLVPILVVHLCYAVSVQAGLIPGCVPYFSGCTSISAAGRHGAGYFLFKGGMIPAATLTAAYWLLCRRWLLALGAPDGAALRALTVLGVVSALFLVLYTVYLGSKGDFYNLMRRYGVTVYLSFGALAQMLLVREFARVPGAAGRYRSVLRAKLALLAGLLALGLASLAAGQVAGDKDRAENVIEWWFAALMSVFYLVSAAAWRASGFSARFAVQAGARREGA